MPNQEILYFEQGSPEWFEARLGSIGGSSIASAVAGGTGSTRQTLMYRLVGEILSGKYEESYKTAAMLQGTRLEPDAVLLYEMVTGLEVDRTVGLIKDSPHKHHSPDGLVNKDGMIEAKCPQVPAHIEVLDKKKTPAKYIRQCNWGLKRCDKEWIDFLSYCPDVPEKPIFILRNYRDEKLIKQLEEGADKFIEEMVSMVERIKRG